MNKTNPLLIILSIFIPIVGIVLFFTKKDDEPGAANTYLWSGIGGFLVALLLMI